MKTLSIIVPHFREHPDQLEHLLSMLDSQIYCSLGNVEIIFVTELGGVYLSDFFDSERFKRKFSNLTRYNLIKYFDLNKVEGSDLDWVKSHILVSHWIDPTIESEARVRLGPGNVRQFGLNKAVGNYVFFCDADDSIVSPLFLNFFESVVINCEGVDRSLLGSAAVGTSYVAVTNTEDGKTVLPVTREWSLPWVFGIFYNRVDLLRYKIGFHADIETNEESWFNYLLFGATAKTFWHPFVTYIWRRSEGSYTRKDAGEYSFTCQPEFIYGRYLITEEYLSRFSDKVASFVFENFLLCWQAVETVNNNSSVPDYWQKQIISCAEWYCLKYKNVFDDFVSNLPKAEYQSSLKNFIVHQFEGFPSVSFESWREGLSLNDVNLDVFPPFMRPLYTKDKKGVAAE